MCVYECVVFCSKDLADVTLTSRSSPFRRIPILHMSPCCGCVWACVRVYVRVCVCEREREREKVRACVFLALSKDPYFAYVALLCVCVFLCVSVHVCVRVYVCVCVRE